MILPNIGLAVAIGLPLASTYPITGTYVNCRSGPSTSFDIVRSYELGDEVSLTCQIAGETVNGDYLWDLTTDGCYVADTFVKTGTIGMVTDECPHSGSSMNGPISREEILARGQVWIDLHVPYSQSGAYPDPAGTDYRTDCSGFVAMAVHASAPGESTVGLIDIGTEIAWEDLQPGDFVGTLGPGTGGDNGHVTLFKSWVNDTKTTYNTIECRGTAYGCVAYQRPVAWKDGNFTSKPYKYIHVE